MHSEDCTVAPKDCCGLKGKPQSDNTFGETKMHHQTCKKSNKFANGFFGGEEFSIYPEICGNKHISTLLCCVYVGKFPHSLKISAYCIGAICHFFAGLCTTVCEQINCRKSENLKALKIPEQFFSNKMVIGKGEKENN